MAEGADGQWRGRPRFDLERDLREQCNSYASRDHLGQRVEAAGAKIPKLAGAGPVTDPQGLVAHAMPVLQQQDLLSGEIGFLYLLAFAKGMSRRQGRHERIRRQRQGGHVAEISLKSDQK